MVEAVVAAEVAPGLAATGQLQEDSAIGCPQGLVPVAAALASCYY